MSSKDEIKDPKQRIKELESSKSKKSIKNNSEFIHFVLVFTTFIIVLITLMLAANENLNFTESAMILSIGYIFFSFSGIATRYYGLYAKDGTAKEAVRMYAKALKSNRNWTMILLILITIYSLITVTYLGDFFDG